jgi:hypothetical protein
MAFSQISTQMQIRIRQSAAIYDGKIANVQVKIRNLNAEIEKLISSQQYALKAEAQEAANVQIITEQAVQAGVPAEMITPEWIEGYVASTSATTSW